MTDMAYRGVIEGFYGRPWSPEGRSALLHDLGAWGMTTYVYGPKDDVKIRAAWREPYDVDELRALARLAEHAASQGVDVHYAIAPGLDLRYADASDRLALRDKIAPLIDVGFRGVSLLFDDIASGLSPHDAAAFASFGVAQADVANELYAWLQGRDLPLIFCPTEYCDRFARPSLEDSTYLRDLGAHLDAGIDVYWTGPEIVSETVTVDAARAFADVLQRAPVLWDNLHANDYDFRRVYLGPFTGRDAALRQTLRGVITNPNVELPANFVPLHTTAAWLRGGDDEASQFERAIDEWWPRFATHGGHAGRDVVTLLVDYLHLPFRFGPEAREHLAAAARTARGEGRASDASILRDRARRLEEAYVRVTELRDRELAYALYGYVWDLKEEADVLARFAQWPGERFCRPDGLANTYRTGIIDALQGVLALEDDGCVAS